MARKPTPKANRPRPVFKSVWEVEHHKRMMIGLPIARRSRTVNYGYDEDPNNPWKLLPDAYTFKALVQARDYLEQGHSAKNIADWLTQATGRQIHYTNLMVLMRDRYPLNEIVEMTQDEREGLTAAIDYWGRAPQSKIKGYSGTNKPETEKD